MACAKQTGNLGRGTIGGRQSLSATVNGWLKTTLTASAAPETLQRNLERLTRPFCSGFGSTRYLADPLRRREPLSIGAQPERTTLCGTGAGNSIRIGAAVSRQTGRRSTPAHHGRRRARLYGNGTRRAVVAAICAAAMRSTCLSTFTMSFRLLTASFVPIRRTWFFYAKPAISSFTQIRT